MGNACESSVYHMTLRHGVIKSHAIKWINQQWFIDLVTLRNGVHCNVA